MKFEKFVKTLASTGVIYERTIFKERWLASQTCYMMVPLGTRSVTAQGIFDKCGHQLYVEETEEFPQKLERIAGMCCPECGEQAEGLWQLLGRSDCFGGEIKVEWEEDTDDEN